MPEHQALLSVHYPSLAGGMRKLAAPRTLTPKTPPHFFRNMQNLVAYKGILRRREGLVGDAQHLLGVAIDLNATGNAQYPVAIFDLTLWPTLTGIRILVVTDKELWIVTGAAPFAFNITPTYATGTVTATNGLTAITGSGTLWETDSVGDGTLIQIQGNWYVLADVTSDTAGVLASPLTSGGGSGLAYTIRRSFYGLKDPSALWLWYGAHARIVLDDIYVAGLFGRYWDGADYRVTGAVLKIDGGADPGKTSFAPSDVTYQFSSEDMDAGGGMDVADRFFAPLGLEVGEDGRLIMPAHMGADSAADPAGAARVWWSSPSDYTEWTLAPAGSADQVQRFSKMTAVGRLGRAFSLHFDDQILLASPTGAANPPLAYIRSRASVGAGGPRLRLNVPAGDRNPGGDFFLAADGHTYVFNGDTAVPVDTGWHEVLSDYTMRQYQLALLHQAHLGYDAVRREVSLFFPDSPTGGGLASKATLELRWHIDSGAMSRHRYVQPLTAMGNAHWGDFIGHVDARLGNQSKVLGGVSFGNGVSAPLLYAASDRDLVDGEPVLVAGETPGGCWFELDDQDLGVPQYQTLLLWVVVWVVGRATVTETLKCRISRDEGLNFEEQTKSVSLTVNQEQAVIFQFAHTHGPGLKWKLRLESNDSDTFSFAVRALTLYGVPAYDLRAG